MMKTWNDLSGYGNGFTLSRAPMVVKDALQLDGISVEGFSSDKLTSTFSIALILQIPTLEKQEEVGEEEMSDTLGEEEDTLPTDEEEVESFVASSSFPLLSIPGNHDYALELQLENSYLYIQSEEKRVRSTKKLYLSNKSMLVVTCTEESQVDVYLDREKIISTRLSKIYLNKDTLSINRKKNIRIELYSILAYTRCISLDEMTDIRNYYIENKNKNVKQFDVNIYYLDTLTGSKSNVSWDSDSEEDSADNCPSACESNCSSFLNEKYDLRKYSNCIDNCKNVLISCNEYCSSNVNSKSKYCQKKKTWNQNCPIGYRKDGKYYIHIAKGSKYANKYDIEGEQLYGNSMEKARKTYQRNFPDCPVPEAFQRATSTSCPFVVNDMNPCQSHVCANVDWNVKDYKKLKMNDSCKKAVSTYCHLNNEWDDMCYCWKPENMEKEKCIQMRKFFENPKDYCKPSYYDIDEHPDFHKYIRKDKIPCWGCDVSSASTT
jgi:hypothetical protein